MKKKEFYILVKIILYFNFTDNNEGKLRLNLTKTLKLNIKIILSEMYILFYLKLKFACNLVEYVPILKRSLSDTRLKFDNWGQNEMTSYDHHKNFKDIGYWNVCIKSTDICVAFF